MVNKKINPDKLTGSRLSSNKIKVQQLNNGQYIITVPQTIASLYRLEKGSIITFKINDKGKLEVDKSG